MTYLDVNLFGKAALDLGEAGDKARELLAKMIKGKKFTTSTLTYDELVWIVRKNVGIPESLDAGKNLLNITSLDLLPVDRMVLSEAQHIQEHHPIKPRDAIHAATALIHNETEIVSDDPDFDKIKDIKRITIEKLKI